MRLVCVSGDLVSGLKDVHAVVPQAVILGENATLICQFDLEGAALYSVKWYIGRREFYRYTPRESPSMKVFPIPGLMELQVQVRTIIFIYLLQILVSRKYTFLIKS